jgi:ketosteroid isomerase-like protein
MVPPVTKEDTVTHPSQNLIQQAHAAFGRGDLDALRGQLADDIKWHVHGVGPLAGDYEGVTAVMGLLGKIVALSGGSARLELHDVLNSADHTVSLVTISAERNGKQFQGNLVQVLHTQNGKVTEVWTHPADPKTTGEFWS